MTEVIVIPDEPVPDAPAEMACCEHCEANRNAIAALIAGQAASADITEEAALEAVAELLELEESGDDASGPSTESDQ